jgi:hypothetical protein
MILIQQNRNFMNSQQGHIKIAVRKTKLFDKYLKNVKLY